MGGGGGVVVELVALRPTRRRAQRQATESRVRLQIATPQSDRCAVKFSRSATEPTSARFENRP